MSDAASWEAVAQKIKQGSPPGAQGSFGITPPPQSGSSDDQWQRVADRVKQGSPVADTYKPGFLHQAWQELKTQGAGLLPSKENLYGLATPGTPLGIAYQNTLGPIAAYRNFKARGEPQEAPPMPGAPNSAAVPTPPRSMPYRLLTGAADLLGLPTGAQGEETSAAHGDFPGVLGHAAVPVAEAVAPLIGEGVLKGFKRVSPTTIRTEASPGLESAGNEVRQTVSGGLTAAEKRVAPLYENLNTADRTAIEKAGGSGAIDIRPAVKVLLEAKEKLYGSAPAPKAAGNVADRLAPYGNTDMVTARALRGQIDDAIGTAIQKGDRPLANALRNAKNEITLGMRGRADQLGLVKDFDTADAQYRHIQELREKLHPLTHGKNSGTVLDTVRSDNPELRNALSEMHENGLLDADRLDELAGLRGKISKAQATGTIPFMKRLTMGALPAGLAYGYMRTHGGLPPELSGISPYIMGAGGISLLDYLRVKAGGLRAIGELPKPEPPAIGLEQQTPSTPRIPEAPPKAPVAAPYQGGPIFRMSDAERARVEMAEEGGQPQEKVLAEGLEATRGTTEGTLREAQLRAQMEKEFERLRTRARTQEAAAPYKGKRKSIVER